MRSELGPSGTAPVPPLDETVDHIQGPAGRQLVLEYGDYECPYSRAAYRHLQRLERAMGDSMRFAFRHVPLTEIHRHACAAAVAAEAAALQGHLWQMTNLLFARQHALKDEDLWRYGFALGLDLARFEPDLSRDVVLSRVRRDVDGALSSRQVTRTPTLFNDRTLHRGAYDTATLREALQT
jgi:Na+:H+ antiporter, NhaA family